MAAALLVGMFDNEDEHSYRNTFNFEFGGRIMSSSGEAYKKTWSLANACAEMDQTSPCLASKETSSARQVAMVLVHSGMPGVIGLIDGSLFPIRCRGPKYGYTAFVGKVAWIHPRFIHIQHQGKWMALGDSGYPLKPYLMR
ncbi:hypothetical protein N1851_024378 [Merluccius polli]|uniref:Uncharacterized protein n=1 Tax=Merluccius polli TaxID=89951 RepID=A0AA47MF37_MERPO|nr:hypothetical protein N1851_024378 [Merluccius polli]